MESASPQDPDEFDRWARGLAKFIAPYVADELASRPETPLGAPDYDAATCRVFVRELGDPVLRRATRFFGALAERGQLTSVEVSGLLGLANQRSIGANMTVSLSKRVKALDLPQPWTLAATPDGERTVWRDRAGIAERMHVALRAEAGRRGMRLDQEGS